MKTIEVLVMVSLIASKVGSKDFCETFKDNGYQIDFSFVYETGFQLFIGKDHWPIDRQKGSLSLKWVSNESFYFEGKYSPYGKFDTKYSAAFWSRGHPSNLDNNIYGFIRESDSKIEWKVVSKWDSKRNYWKIHVTHKYTKDAELPISFKPTATFDFYDSGKKSKYLTFIDQKRVSKSSDLFTRSYLTKELPYQESGEMYPELNTSALFNKTYPQKKGLIIVTKAIDEIEPDEKRTHIILYLRKHSIDYCHQNWTYFEGNLQKTMESALNQKCSEPEVLIDCTPEDSPKADSPPVYWIPILITIVVMCVILIAIVIGFILWRKSQTGGKDHKTEETSQTTPGSPIRSSFMSRTSKTSQSKPKTKKPNPKTLKK